MIKFIQKYVLNCLENGMNLVGAILHNAKLNGAKRPAGGVLQRLVMTNTTLVRFKMEWLTIDKFDIETQQFKCDEFLFFDGVRIFKGSAGWCRKEKVGIFFSSEADGHTYDSWSGDEYMQIIPTHYMELPKPPSAQS
jgi:hypothetical protein